MKPIIALEPYSAFVILLSIITPFRAGFRFFRAVARTPRRAMNVETKSDLFQKEIATN